MESFHSWIKLLEALKTASLRALCAPEGITSSLFLARDFVVHCWSENADEYGGVEQEPTYTVTLK